MFFNVLSLFEFASTLLLHSELIIRNTHAAWHCISIMQNVSAPVINYMQYKYNCLLQIQLDNLYEPTSCVPSMPVTIHKYDIKDPSLRYLYAQHEGDSFFDANSPEC